MSYPSHSGSPFPSPINEARRAALMLCLNLCTLPHKWKWPQIFACDITIWLHPSSREQVSTHFSLISRISRQSESLPSEISSLSTAEYQIPVRWVPFPYISTLWQRSSILVFSDPLRWEIFPLRAPSMAMFQSWSTSGYLPKFSSHGLWVCSKPFLFSMLSLFSKILLSHIKLYTGHLSTIWKQTRKCIANLAWMVHNLRSGRARDSIKSKKSVTSTRAFISNLLARSPFIWLAASIRQSIHI